MIKPAFTTLLILSAHAAVAEESRHLGAHEHGVGQLDIAFEGAQITMELHAPGADIVGFEYAAQSSEDRSTIETAIATLSRPLDLFSFPPVAGCSVVEASASLESEGAHEDHDEEGHDHDAHDEEDHDHDAHDEEGHDHDAHDEEGHDHDAHDEEGHDHDAYDEEGHDHDAHDDEGHTEFHAEYLLTCIDPAQVNLSALGYFTAFPNALELEVQAVSDRGATALEVKRDAPMLDLRNLL